MSVGMFGWANAMRLVVANKAITNAMDKVVLQAAVKASDYARDGSRCPYLTGTLQKSLAVSSKWENPEHKGGPVKVVSGEKLKPQGKEIAVRLVGSSLPYCARQEFEHATKHHFIHKGVDHVKESMKENANKVMEVVLAGAWKGKVF